MQHQPLTVVFRVDASIQIGSGHVMRCLTLADELRRLGHQCVFVCREHEGHLGDAIVDKGYPLELLSMRETVSAARDVERGADHATWLGVPWQVDAEQTLAALRLVEADWLIVDHYSLDARWEKRLSLAVNRILVIDDLADRKHQCDLLLDQNLGRDWSDYDELLPERCTRIVGPRFALLRPEFVELRERSLLRRKQLEPKRMLISLGGVDKTNITGQVLKALRASRLSPETELDIVMGASAPYLETVRRQADSLPFKTLVSVSVSDMANRMCAADLSIGAAGGTAWERCCLGLPSIVLVLAENQKSGAMALKNSGGAVVLDNLEALSMELPAALSALSELRSLPQMSFAAAQVVDGHGVGRIVEYMVGIARRHQ